MAVCSNVNSAVLYDGGNENRLPNCRKRPKEAALKLRNVLCVHLQRKLFKRLKGCTILVHVFVPQAVKITERGWKGKRESFRLCVCVYSV